MSFFQKISRRQAIRDVINEADHSKGLRKVLGVTDLVAFGISSTLGSGIFVSVGLISQFAGPAIFLSFAIAAIGCLLSASCYAEFASMVPVSGQSYTYTYVALGEVVAFITGWLGFLAYSVAAAAVSRGWAAHVSSLIESVWGVTLPNGLVNCPIEDVSMLSVSGLAVFLNLACTVLGCLGVTHSTRLASLLVVVNVSIMAGFSIYGAASYGEASNLVPLLPSGLGGVLKGSGLAFFCLTGWELTCTLSEEVRNPSRDLPRGILTALLSVTILYCSVCLTLSSMVPNENISVSAPIVDAFRFHNDEKGAFLVSLTVIIVCIPSTISGIVGTPRIIYKMAKDGLLFPFLAKVNRYGSPVAATMLCGLFSASLAGFVSFESLAASCSAATLFMFAVVCIGLVVVRVRENESPVDPGLTNGLILSLLAFIITSFAFCLCLSAGNSESVSIFLLGVVNILSFCICIRFYRSATRVTFDPTLALVHRMIMDGKFDKPDRFRCPFVPYLPLVAAWVNIMIVASLGPAANVGLILMLLSGLAMYLLYGIRHSKLSQVL